MRDNGLMTIWVKVYEGTSPYERALPGYSLKVFRDGVDVSQPVVSESVFYNTGRFQGNYDYNLKFELPNAGEADWEIYLAEGATRVSLVTQFTTKGDLYRNLVAYIAYWRAR